MKLILSIEMSMTMKQGEQGKISAVKFPESRARFSSILHPRVTGL